MVTPEHLQKVFDRKYDKVGWGPEQRRKFGYFNPDDIYEATIDSLITRDTEWLDVGCGRDVFPSNFALAEKLSERCRYLVGLDPSNNIDENPLLHERFKGMIEDYRTNRRFDLITLRMVAEHIQNPADAAACLSRLCKPGGRAVIYTVYKWSPVTVVSAAVPFQLHHQVKKVIWQTEEKDTFPTEYRMNTRRDLRRIFEAAGFQEAQFQYLDDCRSLARWRWTNLVELVSWKALHSVGLHYPEVCLLGIYRKQDVS